MKYESFFEKIPRGENTFCVLSAHGTRIFLSGGYRKSRIYSKTNEQNWAKADAQLLQESHFCKRLQAIGSNQETKQ